MGWAWEKKTKLKPRARQSKKYSGETERENMGIGTNDWDALLLRSEELVKQVRGGRGQGRDGKSRCSLRRWNHR